MRGNVAANCVGDHDGFQGEDVGESYFRDCGEVETVSIEYL